MDQKQLREFERKCIQEEPAYCSAACPFHMDVKAFLRQMAKEDADKAFKVIETRLPLPEIMARICDHPCESSCIRKKIDKPLSIGFLEKVCALSRSRQKKIFLPPPKENRAGIWGSGLSSLTVAWDLALKGVRITLFDRAEPFGGPLRGFPMLPQEILDLELQRLVGFGVECKTAPSPETAFFSGEDFDAVYLGFDSDSFPRNLSGMEPGIEMDEKGMPLKDEFTLQTRNSSIFAGGFSRDGRPDTRLSFPADLAFQGRKAAVSMDRFMAKVSMTAGRDREGPFQTRLSTDTTRVEPCAPIVPDLEKPNLELAAREAGRCIQCDCSRCIRVCSYIREFKGFPGRYAREIYNNAAIVMGERKANLLINSCSLCRLCETVCPNDFSMADLCLSARHDMKEKGKMPQSAHEFALDHMARASGGDCFFARHAPGTDGSDQIFFPGCQLTGSAPFQVEKAYDFLQNYLSGRTGFVSGCCGAPAWWAGDREKFEANILGLKAFWEASGSPPLITACTSCSSMLAEALPGAEIRSIYEDMAGIMDKDSGAVADLSKDPGGCCQTGTLLLEPVNIIDPCTAREDSGVRKAVRKLVRYAGLTIEDLPASGSLTECCGFGGLVFNANPKLSKKIIQERAGQSPRDFIAYCAMCRDRLASAEKKALHVLDLFWPGTDHPELRKDPGFSKRQDTLTAVKNEFLGRIWREKAKSGEKTDPRIRISPEVEDALENRFILVSDIQKVLEEYESTGVCFLNPEKGSRIAFYRPSRVCFWVEFIQKEDRFEILSAWSHRMEVEANGDCIPGPPTHPLETPVLCGPCNLPLEYYKNNMTYLGSRFDVALPQCSRCKAVFISSELTHGKIEEVEKILEDK
ncbi:pyridine nucleotide-disulfide oxidoreductase/dicluster-binding protein [Desulfospira joergensenii]|uniref:pyridine nucleotide-disulfide oxidoreductase/dicluster-binding protein n=1 Tax=Desulfospira joergensenii TaxID=53329 RepID=UPI0003B4BA75|nr:pyridine nucleotide-disulfide oxidoreductase/dicluster-binding protein [Desulfospira joergensenii]